MATDHEHQPAPPYYTHNTPRWRPPTVFLLPTYHQRHLHLRPSRVYSLSSCIGCTIALHHILFIPDSRVQPCFTYHLSVSNILSLSCLMGWRIAETRIRMVWSLTPVCSCSPRSGEESENSPEMRLYALPGWVNALSLHLLQSISVPLSTLCTKHVTND